MDNEIPLPPPRRVRHRSPARGPPSSSGSVTSSFRRTRRLSRLDDCSSQPSSDPALFSSDDIPASGLENYNAPVAAGAGRKRRYRGTWWGDQVVDPKRKRADFKEKRHVDSGVWMGSDESVAESSLPSEDASGWGEDLLKTVLDPQAQSKSPIGPSNAAASSLAPAKHRPMPLGLPESEEHRIARTIVHECLEKGDDSIDLGNLNLGFIPRDLLRPLQHMTKLPSVTEAPKTENAYTSLLPFLRIYLPSNNLTSISPEILELKNLKVLSVRNNRISSLPSSIGKLKALETLNLSVNHIRYLPWELLGLLQGELKHLIVGGNPFPNIADCEIATWYNVSGKSDKAETGSDQTVEAETSRNGLYLTKWEWDPPAHIDLWGVVRVATGPVKRLDMDGQRVGNASSPDTTTTWAAHPPSLRELALRTLVKMPGLERVTDEELTEFPPLLRPLFSLAKSWRSNGGWRCSVCEREYVHPRTQWTEWWDCMPHENGMKMHRTTGHRLRPLPFRRYGCSWDCVP